MDFDEKKYQSALAALFEKHRSVQTAGFNTLSYKPGLDSIRNFDKVLGYPSSRLLCIHVAGTNGKGSVSSMLAAALASCGLRVGLYTSPHLVDFRERIRIIGPDGMEMIPRGVVYEFLEKFSSAAEGLSFFEVTTGMAFHWFASQNLDRVVLETGLGGRLDSTNIVTPEISIITSIGLDHCSILGDTVQKIAREKAGIFKPGVPALVSTSDDATSGVFREVASSVGCPLYFADRMPENGAFGGEEELYESLELRGPGQRQNLHTALSALEILGLRSEAAAHGIKKFASLTGLRGRWEHLSYNPETICDIGHNPPALSLNFERLEFLRGKGRRRRPLLVVYGVMKDKDLSSISHCFPSDAVFFLCSPGTERALPAHDLKSRMGELRPDIVTVDCGDVVSACDRASEYAKSLDSPMIYIGGSTFVVSEAIVYYGNVHYF